MLAYLLLSTHREAVLKAAVRLSLVYVAPGGVACSKGCDSCAIVASARYRPKCNCAYRAWATAPRVAPLDLDVVSASLAEVFIHHVVVGSDGHHHTG